MDGCQCFVIISQSYRIKTITVGGVVHMFRMLFILCLFFMPMSIHPSRIWVLFNTLGGCYAKNCNGMKQEQVFRCYKYESEADGFCLSLQILAIACHVIFHSSLTVQSCARQLNTLTNRITTFVVCSFLKTQSHRSLVDSKYEPWYYPKRNLLDASVLSFFKIKTNF